MHNLLLLLSILYNIKGIYYNADLASVRAKDVLSFLIRDAVSFRNCLPLC